MLPYKELFPYAGLVLPNTRLVAERVIVLPSGTMLPDQSIDVITSILKLLSRGKK